MTEKIFLGNLRIFFVVTNIFAILPKFNILSFSLLQTFLFLDPLNFQ